MVPPPLGKRSVSASKGLMEGRLGLSACIRMYYWKREGMNSTWTTWQFLFLFYFAKWDPPSLFHEDRVDQYEIFAAESPIALCYPN